MEEEGVEWEGKQEKMTRLSPWMGTYGVYQTLNWQERRARMPRFKKAREGEGLVEMVG